ncbi:MAG TPA: hypothetical protein VIV65_01660 [Gemmatimonadaceae bacterium]
MRPTILYKESAEPTRAELGLPADQRSPTRRGQRNAQRVHTITPTFAERLRWWVERVRERYLAEVRDEMGRYNRHMW